MIMYLYHHRFAKGQEFGLYAKREDAERLTALEKHSTVCLAEVISCTVQGTPELWKLNCHAGTRSESYLHWDEQQAMHHAEDRARAIMPDGVKEWHDVPVGGPNPVRWRKLWSRTANGGLQDTGWEIGLAEVL